MTKTELGPQNVGKSRFQVSLRLGPFLLFIAFAIGVALYSWLVWPTPYAIFHDEEEGTSRVERSTGVKERATSTGWKTQEQIVEDNKAKGK